VNPNPTGLRERKKIKTRLLIQQTALKLFRAQGYEETTVEQIAAAAEISVSTLFRYFPTKEDVALVDFYDDLMVEAFRLQPAELNPIAAFRGVVRTVYGTFTSEEDAALEWERNMLVLTMPKLRARLLEDMGNGFKMIGKIIAERSGRSPEDREVGFYAGAILGVSISALFKAVEMNAKDSKIFVKLLDEGLAYLEKGLPL